MIITCIISCAGHAANIPVLKTCIRSLRSAKTPKTKLLLVVTTNNHRHHIKKGSFVDNIFVSSGGFVGINNKAVQETIHKKSDYYLIINDDAWVNKNFFAQLEALHSINEVPGDILVPYIYEGNKKTIDSFGVEYFRTGYSKNAFSSEIKTSLASMSCLLIQTKFIRKMITTYGFFLNPLLEWYLDDVEFSIRALAIGGTIHKCKNIVAHHMRTFTWGRKSYFVMYQSFRNLLWVILLTWPLTIIRRNIIRIVCWQIIVAIYCFVKYSPLLYPKILIDTLRHFPSIKSHRKNILRKYTNARLFYSLFSSLEIRHPRLTI